MIYTGSGLRKLEFRNAVINDHKDYYGSYNNDTLQFKVCFE